MNEDIKAAWISWLENPTHEQTRNRLKADVGQKFCVLGALMKVAEERGVDIFDLQWHGHYLPRRVKEWAELDSYNPSVTVDGRVRSLTDLNDLALLTFSELAITIKESL